MGKKVSDTKISVIVPVYNVEPYLRQCLDSIVCQSLNDIEIICIDDGSTDGSLEILKEYEKNDKRIVLRSRENKGLSATRNDALDIANGEYVIFIDSDDFLAEGALERLYQLAVQHDLDIISFTATVVYESEKLREKYPDIYYHREHLSEESINKEILSGPELLRVCVENEIYLATVWSYFYKTSFIEKNALRFALCMHEDEDWSVRALLSAERGYLVCEPLYYYRQRERSIVNNPENIIESAYCDFRIGLSILDYVHEGTYSKEVQAAVENHANVLFYMARASFYSVDESEQKILLDRMSSVERHLFEKLLLTSQIPVEQI